jgi:guanylate kinase
MRILSYKLWENTKYKKNIIILTGPGGSGKDFAMDLFINAGLKPAVLYTTRSQRDGEIEGTTYHYISHEEFEEGIKLNRWFQKDQFGPEWYGISHSEWDKSDIIILSPRAVDRLNIMDRKSSFIIYFKISEDIRRDRLSTRSDADANLENRLVMDRENFATFNTYDIEITDEYFKPNDILKYVNVLSDK